MEQVVLLCDKVNEENASIRQVAREMGVSRGNVIDCFSFAEWTDLGDPDGPAARLVVSLAVGDPGWR